VSCTPRAVNLRRDSDRIGFRLLASARGPDHEAPLRCGFGCIVTRCPPSVAVFGSCTTEGTRDQLIERGPRQRVLRHSMAPAPSPRRWGGCGTERLQATTLSGRPGSATRGAMRWETGSPAAKKDLEKERSPGRSGSSTHRQRRGTSPDSTTEQGLEADAPDPPTPTDLEPATEPGEARR
jgi:hypothetical protein